MISALIRAALARVLNLPEDNIPDHVGTPVSKMAEDDRIYCMIFIGTQMTKNMPRVGHWTGIWNNGTNEIYLESQDGDATLMVVNNPVMFSAGKTW